jgi:SAM-dependent methyltransferase
MERHRFVWLYFGRMTTLFDGKPKRMLHVAPEKCFEPRLKKRLGEGYVTADLADRLAMVRMDITDIQCPDGCFDVIYCSHVLEHVQDDRRAMREFYRVLKQDGWAILIVPIGADRTFEDPSIVDPSQRLRVFGKEDHVRRYGADFADRLREAGFKVRVSRVVDLFEKDDIVRMGLSGSDDIHYCSKA